MSQDARSAPPPTSEAGASGPTAGADALKLRAEDNVATLLHAMTAGELCRIGTPEGSISIRLAESIPMHHKVALTPITRQQPVLKYGEVIGQARLDIPLGGHVHTHNLVSLRAGAR
jgi:altronate dehydratase small subunit